MTFNELYTEWIDTKRGIVKESTVCNYASMYQYVIKPYFGDREVSQFGKADGQKFLSQCLSAGRSVKYARDSINVLRQIVEYGTEMYDIHVPVDFKVKYPTRNMEETDKVHAYTKEEASRIIDYCMNNPSSKNIGFVIAFHTGLRIGELCGLRWEDVDFSERIIHIRRTFERIHEPGKKAKLVFQTPKTRHSRRDVPIPRHLSALLKKLSSVARPDYYIISGSDKPIEPRTYRDYYNRLIPGKVGLTRVLKFHSIRHTFASMLITGGQDVKTVSELLGHSNAGITLNIYAHSNETSKRRCAESLKFI